MKNGEERQYADEVVLGVIASSGARSLIVGRRALIILGLPVMTGDYDLWVHTDDIEKLNAAFDALDHIPNKSAEQARATGRYIIENGERIDVLVARFATTKDGVRLSFDDAWSRRQPIEIAPALTVALPSIQDLITTKLWSARPKDLADKQLLEALARKQQP